MLHQKQCEKCKQIFETTHIKGKYCSFRCSDQVRIERINANWMKEKKYIRPNNDRIEYSRVSKKPMGWMKKFNACRG